MPREPVPSELLGSISHALAGPLISGRVAVQTLQERYPADEEVRTLAAAITRASSILDAIVRIGATGRAPFVEEVALDDALRTTLRRIRAGGKDLQVEAGALDRVRADESHVVSLLGELLANVVDHAGPDPRAELRSRRDDGVVCLVVADAGPGLPEDFDRASPPWFARGGGSSPRAGSGLAVALALAEVNGGSVELRDGAGGGTEALVRLPAAEG